MIIEGMVPNQIKAAGSNTIAQAIELHRKGELDRAAAIYQEILSKQPANADAWHLSGLVHLARKEIDEARRRIQIALDMSPRSSRYLFSMGNVVRATGDFNGALRCFDEALEVWPKFAEAHNHKGVVLLNNKRDVVGAIEAFSQAIQCNSDFFLAMDNLALACFSLVRQRLQERLIPDDELDSTTQPDAAMVELVKKARAYRYLYCPQYRFVYAPIPKAACSSFKMLLYSIFKREIPELPQLQAHRGDRNFHLFIDRSFSMIRYTDAEAQAILASKRVFKFTLVRNPFDRISSAYVNKFVTNRLNKEQYEHTLPVLRDVFGKDADPRAHSLSFRQFVDYLVRHSDLELDKHWRPMVRMVDPARMDMVMRMETIREDYDQLREKLQIPMDLQHLNTSARAVLDAASGEFADYGAVELCSLPSMPTTIQLYDDKLEQAIRERYKSDFELFGYPDSLHNHEKSS